MRFSFFGERDNEPEPEEERAKNVIVPTEGNEIVPTLDSEDVDLALYDHVTLDVRTIGGEAYADALIPMAAKAADAAANGTMPSFDSPKAQDGMICSTERLPAGRSGSSLASSRTASFSPRPQSGRRSSNLLQ